ncbi:MAG: hypothetical protein NUV68_08025 [Caldiserica bacterium]|jgi:hypothetical protein|nr:hypothetical protein [Caldisericota bacterium]MDH7563230.1 hypothetical protein [Caldisericota bacterium]
MLKKFVLFLLASLLLLAPSFPTREAVADSSIVRTVAPGIIARGGQTEVAMVREEVSIVAPSARLPSEENVPATVHCTFYLENQGENPESIEVGFPLKPVFPPDLPPWGSKIEDLK